MGIQSPRGQRMSATGRVKLFRRQAHPGIFVRKVLRRLGTQAYPSAPTVEQRNLVLTSFVLGGVSIFMAFFPICGLPVAITGLVLGLYGQRTTTLHTMSTWAIALSTFGLVLTFINIIITISIYLGTYVWGVV